MDIAILKGNRFYHYFFLFFSDESSRAQLGSAQLASFDFKLNQRPPLAGVFGKKKIPVGLEFAIFTTFLNFPPFLHRKKVVEMGNSSPT